MKRARPRGPVALGALLAGSALSRGGRRLDRDAWTRAVGDRVAARTEPVSADKGVLTVRVGSSVWAQELSLLGPTIVGRLRAAGWLVSSLRFVVGEVSPPAGSVARRIQPRAPAPLPDDLHRRLAAIEDPELRRAIAEAAAHLLADGDDRT